MTIKDDLATDVPDLLMRADIDGTVMTRLHMQAEAQLRRDLNIRAQRATLSISATEQATDNAVPVASVLYIVSATQGVQGYPLTQLPLQTMKECDEYFQSGTPKYFALDGDTLLLAPAPSSASPATISMTYVRMFEDFELPFVDGQFLGNYAYDMLLYLHLAFAAEYVHDFELKNYFMGEYKRSVAELNRAESLAMDVQNIRPNGRY